MVKKKIRYKDYYLLEQKKKRYRNHFIVYLLTLIPCLLALIGFNVLPLYSATNFFLALLDSVLKPFGFFINGFLIMFDSFIGLFFAHAMWGFISIKRKMNRFQYSVPMLENTILRFLINNKGQSFTSASIISQVNYQGTLEEFSALLSHLVQDCKIIRTMKDETLNYSINL